jgi:phospholipase C
MAFNQIQHVFVLMLENRSLDHLLGFSEIAGTDAVSGAKTVLKRPLGNGNQLLPWKSRNGRSPRRLRNGGGPRT